MKILKSCNPAILVVLLVGHAMGQTYSKTDHGIKTTVNGTAVEVQFYSPAIVRVLKWPANTSPKKESLSVIKKPEAVSFNVSQSGSIIAVSSSAVKAELDVRNGKVSFYASNSPMLSEKEDFLFTPMKDGGENAYIVKQAFALEKEEAIYGLGQQQHGRLNQRGLRILLMQDNMKIAIPFFQSIKGYGLFWDNYSPTTFADNAHETSFDSEAGDMIDYYFMYGGNADGVVAQMRNLTGQAPMLPLWVFGFNQSKERYKTQDELLATVAKYRSLRVPLDGIIQDWQYWGDNSYWNAMSFNKERFPNPKLMADSVHKMNAHLFIVAWPNFGPNTLQYKDFKQRNLMFNFECYPPEARVYNAYSREARDLYWDYLNKGVFSHGNDGWWLDATEPEHVFPKDKDFEAPTALGTFRRVRNAFPLIHTGGVYQHQRQTTSDKRVTILTRSAFAGQQRNSTIVWSGDVDTKWPVFRKQISAGLNLSLCGIPYWNTDIGGFYAVDFNGDVKNPDFQEIYTRWMQFAAFTPMMRSHGTVLPREIYQFGKAGDPIYDAQEKFITLRYRLLPYTYSVAWAVTHNAYSLYRALPMDFSQDKKVHDMDNEFMYGPSILATPVTEKGVKTQSVYLPDGTKWYDFWTGEITAGGKTAEKAVPIDIMPLYVKAGSILPWGPNVQYAEEKKWDNLEIRIYPGADASFTLYEDENNNYNYEKGMYSAIAFKWSDKEKTLTVGEQKGQFPGMLTNRKFNIVIVQKGNGAGIPLATKFNKTIAYKGKAIRANIGG